MLEELREANGYIHKKIDKHLSQSKLLKEIEVHAELENVPIISKEAVEYLKFIIRSNGKIKNILEIGTATAYSGLSMLSSCPDRELSLTTIEIDEARYNIAKENFAKSGLKNVKQILGDASLELDNLKETYDFIFIDASKGQYKDFFEKSYKLLNQGGIIFIDNIMFRGYLYKESPKRFKTIVRRLDEFIDFLYENYNFVLLPFADGIGLVYKK